MPKPEYSYDIACADLAARFLEGTNCPEDKLPDEIAELAQLVQDTVESHLGLKGFE